MPEKERPEAGDLGPGQNKRQHKPDTKISSHVQARPREVALYDGQTLLGKIVMHSGKRFEAFDPAGNSLGKFSTVSAAYDACSEAAR